MNSHQYLTKIGRFSNYVALASFGIGTLLLLLQKLFPSEENIILIGLGYVVVALLINLLVFIFLLYHFFVNPFHREYFAGKMFILLANIPVAGLYFFLVINSLI